MKILNLNMWLLPWPFSIENYTRLHKFVNLVKELSPDVVTLQEVWLNKYVRFLRENLEEYSVSKTDNGLFNISGLLTLTRVKPQSVKHYRYSHTRKLNLPERIAQKGYLVTKIKIRGKGITIINTHIYKPIFESERAISISQFRELKEVSSKETNVIIGADLNISFEDFKKENSGFFAYEKNNAIHANGKNKYQKSRLNYGKYNEKHDYIICSSKSSKPGMKSRVITEPIISDHYPYYAEIKI